METETPSRRGLVLILVIVTVLLFVGLVWVIAANFPRSLTGFESPSITPSLTPGLKNCTHPVSYWRLHSELYPPEMVIGGVVYIEKDLEAIFKDETQDLTQQLQAQLVSAYLNILAGADQSSIETTIFEAYGWLVKHPTGSQITDNELSAGTRLFNELEAYNLGLTGVTPCEPTSSLSMTETSTVTETPTSLLNSTASQTSTPTLSETPSPTKSPTVPIRTVIVPTKTPVPPVATDTPIPATKAPTSTNTSVPSTPTFTPPPPPTSTFTPPPLPSPTDTSPPPR